MLYKYFFFDVYLKNCHSLHLSAKQLTIEGSTRAGEDDIWSCITYTDQLNSQATLVELQQLYTQPARFISSMYEATTTLHLFSQYTLIEWTSIKSLNDR